MCIQAVVAIWRSARDAASNWRALRALLQSKARLVVPMKLWVSGCWSPPFWRRRPFVRLHVAAAGFVDSDSLGYPVEVARKALVEARREIRAPRLSVCLLARLERPCNSTK